jgi:predicted secreted protein
VADQQEPEDVGAPQAKADEERAPRPEAAAEKPAQEAAPGRSPDEPSRNAGRTEETRTAGGRTGAQQAGKDAGDGKAFELLDKALESTDWGWKTKQGDDRELGRLSFVHAQNAWVAAAIEDPKRATSAWVKKTNGNPSSEMERKLADKTAEIGKGQAGKQQGGGRTELDGLSSDLADLSNRRNLSEAKTRKTALRSSLGEWNIMRGDATQRSEQAKRSRQNELWSAEPNRADDGLHLLKSFVKGYATHREKTQARVERHKARMSGGAIKDTLQELGRVSNDIKKFETELNVPMAERQSIGLVGKSRKAVANHKAFKLGIGTASVVAKVTRKVAEKGAEVAKSVAIQGAALTAAPGAIDGSQGNANYQQRMAAFHQFQRSRGGAGPSL